MSVVSCVTMNLQHFAYRTCFSYIDNTLAEARLNVSRGPNRYINHVLFSLVPAGDEVLTTCMLKVVFDEMVF